MKRLSTVILVCVVFAGITLAGEHPEHPKAAKAAAVGHGMLDGKVFVGELAEKGKQKGDKDEFVFNHGTFVSTACVPYGFDKTPYDSQKKNGSFVFTAEPMNSRKETMSWHGTVTKAKITGTAIYHRKGGWFKKAKNIEYSFQGTLKLAGQKSDHPTKKSEHPEHAK